MIATVEGMFLSAFFLQSLRHHRISDRRITGSWTYQSDLSAWGPDEHDYFEEKKTEITGYKTGGTTQVLGRPAGCWALCIGG